ncbi:Double-strand-break repair protein rad21 -like protein [Sarcoptes scabiei]|uniref:Sister chromatid cohesion 1 protein 4 n=1 Tax=Sarcoptes scabiei TaxID=52283 RepID=A0A834R570_SARSC|nr:Double-strand-break repair protein rad21 -like protein [Sarcoptes scabiei]
MFYIPEILSRKGPLSIVWLAAHFEKKLTKNQIMEANVAEIIDLVMNSNIKISLRITCDLIIGICRINKYQNKFLLNESEYWIGRVETFAGRFSTIKDRHQIKSKRSTRIDLPETDSVDILTLNVPEIFDYFDLNLPDVNVPQQQQPIVSKRSITIDEIPPLTEEERKIEEEIEKKIYGLDKQSSFESIEEFFEDFVPPKPKQSQLFSDNDLISVIDDQNETFTALKDDNRPRPHRHRRQKVSTTEIEPILSEIQAKYDRTYKRLHEDQRDDEISVEKRRKPDVYDISGIASLELVPLDESSRKSLSLPQKQKKKSRRQNFIQKDLLTKIPDAIMRKNFRRKFDFNKMIPDTFLPSSRFTLSSLNDPCRPLPKLLQNHFFNAIHNELFDDSAYFEEKSISLIRDKQTLDELPSPPQTFQIADENFMEPFPMPESQPPVVSPLVDPIIVDQFEESDLPRGIQGRSDDQDPTWLNSILPEFSKTDQTLIEERFNSSLQDLFSINDRTQFEQLTIEKNQKYSAALYFYNLLEMMNNGLVELFQEESLEDFNPIHIEQIRQSGSI